MTTKHAPFRFDHVGSFLRPQYLLDARDKREKGEISADELREIEDKAIIDLIKKEEAAGLKDITDGEFRRYSWHCDFFWGFQGVDQILHEPHGSKFKGKTYGITARISGKISGENHPFIKDWKFTKAHASDDVDVKLTIPAPSQFVQEAGREINIEATKAIYQTRQELVDDTVKAYTTTINDLYDAGLRTLQFDDCTWSRLISGKSHSGREYSKEELEDLKKLYVTVNNAVIANKPDGLVINSHVCRGNFASTWFASGGYDSVATPLLDQENVNAYYLEYDSERAGTFEPLAKVTPGKKVVLGLVTTKFGKLEDKDKLIERIHEAAQYVPLENLGISPQCGFSSNAVGNEITEQDQWNKLALIKEVAEEVWGKED